MIIDVHAHFVSSGLLEDARLRNSPVGFEEETNRLVFPSGPSRPIPDSLVDLDQRADWMTSRNIDLQVVSPWMDILGVDLSTEEQWSWCRMYNDSVAADLEGNAQFRALAALPVSSGELSASELSRAVNDLGFVGGAIPTQVGEGVDLDEAGLSSLFEAAEALGVPLFVHPFKVMARERMNNHFLFNICGNPFETTLAALRLFFSGAFDTWPGLTLLLAHAGGTLPLVAGRAVHASRHAAGFDEALGDSSEILGRFYYDTILHDPKALRLAIDVAGPDRFALGSDYPFPMWLDDPVTHLDSASDQTEFGVDVVRHQVAESTPARLFGL